MKLLPKPRGKVTRKPILGTEKEQRNKFNYNETYIAKYRGKKLIYNDFAKKIIQENPGILKAMDYLSSIASERRFVDPKGKFEILRVTESIVKNDSTRSRGSYTKNSFVISINDAKKHKFYIKESEYGIELNEFVTVNTIEKYVANYGFKIIKPHLSYLNPNKVRNYIAYDFTNKLTVLDALKLNKIPEYLHNQIKAKLEDLHFSLLSLHNIDVDISELGTRNCFIDLKTNELYLFDIVKGNLSNAKSISELTKELIKK